MDLNYKRCADLYTILNKYNIIAICNNIDIEDLILYFIDYNAKDITNTLLYLEKYRNDLNNSLKKYFRIDNS